MQLINICFYYYLTTIYSCYTELYSEIKFTKLTFSNFCLTDRLYTLFHLPFPTIFSFNWQLNWAFLCSIKLPSLFPYMLNWAFLRSTKLFHWLFLY